MSEGRHVAYRHGDESQHGEHIGHGEDRALGHSVEGGDSEEDPDGCDEASLLRGSCKECADCRGGALVGVRDPHVERDYGHLEPEASDEQ